MEVALIWVMKNIIEKTATSVAAMLLLTGMACQAGSIRIGDTPAARIAKDTHIPGKGKAGQCLPFAQALHHKLEAAGIPSRVVVYGYESGGVPVPGAGGEIAVSPILGDGAGRGSHAVVIYDDGGRTYVMDNQSWTPQWVRDATPIHMAQQFSGINTSVKMARVLPEQRAPRDVSQPRRSTRLAAN